MADSDRSGRVAGAEPAAEAGSDSSPVTDSDPALIDLLGALAYGELSAFDRLAGDARLAPTMAGRAALSQMAVLEFGHFRALTDRLSEHDVDPYVAMAPFVTALDHFHDLTTPSTWLEG